MSNLRLVGMLVQEVYITFSMAVDINSMIFVGFSGLSLFYDNAQLSETLHSAELLVVLFQFS